MVVSYIIYIEIKAGLLDNSCLLKATLGWAGKRYANHHLLTYIVSCMMICIVAFQNHGRANMVRQKNMFSLKPKDSISLENIEGHSHCLPLPSGYRREMAVGL